MLYGGRCLANLAAITHNSAEVRLDALEERESVLVGNRLQSTVLRPLSNAERRS